MTRPPTHQRILDLTRAHGILRARDVEAAGIHTQVLTTLVADGVLERVARGRYRLADAEITEHHGLALVAAAVPAGVICLLSALQFHEIGTQLPREVWVAVDRRARRPALGFPPLRVVRFSGQALTAGVEHHVIEGQTVHIYSAAKTVADCFKYRNKIGLDVALEALAEGWRLRRFTLAELNACAAIDRVQRVMQPYIEAVIL